MTRRRRLWLLALLGAVPIGRAEAQEALYGAQPPKGSAYVRFANALDDEVRVRPDFLPAATLGVAAANRVGAYVVVEKVAGRPLGLDVEAGRQTGHATVQAPPDGFLTIVVLKDAGGALTVAPIADLAAFNQNRARLSFYNAIAGCADGVLALDPGGQQVFHDVAPAASMARAVNPTGATLKASCTGAAAAPVTLSGVEAGSMFSIWLIKAGSEPTAFVTQDIATPYKR